MFPICILLLNVQIHPNRKLHENGIMHHKWRESLFSVWPFLHLWPSPFFSRKLACVSPAGQQPRQGAKNFCCCLDELPELWLLGVISGWCFLLALKRPRILCSGWSVTFNSSFWSIQMVKLPLVVQEIFCLSTAHTNAQMNAFCTALLWLVISGRNLCLCWLVYQVSPMVSCTCWLLSVSIAPKLHIVQGFMSMCRVGWYKDTIVALVQCFCLDVG